MSKDYPTGTVPKTFERSERSNANTNSQGNGEGFRSLFHNSSVNRRNLSRDNDISATRQDQPFQQLRDMRPPRVNGLVDSSTSLAGLGSDDLTNPDELASRLTFLEDKIRQLRSIQNEFGQPSVKLAARPNTSGGSHINNLDDRRGSDADHVANIRELQRAVQMLALDQPGVSGLFHQMAAQNSSRAKNEKAALLKTNTRNGSEGVSQDGYHSRSDHTDRGDLGQVQGINGGREVEHQMSLLQHRIDHLARGLYCLRREQKAENQEKDRKLQQQEKEITLLTTSLNQSFVALNVLQNEVTGLRQAVSRLERVSSRDSESTHLQQLQQEQPSLNNSFRNSTSHPFFLSENLDGSRNGDLDQWNFDNFEIDLANGLGLPGSFFRPESSWPGSDLGLEARRTSSTSGAAVSATNLESLNLVAESMAGSSNRGMELNNKVPPGIRANNYWDNFRSFSHQNRFSSVTNPIVAQVPPRPQQPQRPNQLDRRLDNTLAAAEAFALGSLSAAGGSPTPPRRKQKINREHNRSDRPSNLSSLTEDHHAGSSFNRFIPIQQGQTVRVYPMPQAADPQQQNQPGENSGGAVFPSPVRRPARSLSDSVNVNSIKQSIYDCINQLISQHEQHPDYLANIFENLQRLDKDRVVQETNSARSSRMSTNNLDDVPVQQDQPHPRPFQMESFDFFTAAGQQSRTQSLAWGFPSDNEDEDNDRAHEDEDTQDGNRLFNACKVTSNKRLEILTRHRNSEDRGDSVASGASGVSLTDPVRNVGHPRSFNQKGNNFNNRPNDITASNNMAGGVLSPTSRGNAQQQYPWPPGQPLNLNDPESDIWSPDLAPSTSFKSQPKNLNQCNTLQNDGSLRPLNQSKEASNLSDQFVSVNVKQPPNASQEDSRPCTPDSYEPTIINGIVVQFPGQNEAAEADWDHNEVVQGAFGGSAVPPAASVTVGATVMQGLDRDALRRRRREEEAALAANLVGEIIRTTEADLVVDESESTAAAAATTGLSSPTSG